MRKQLLKFAGVFYISCFSAQNGYTVHTTSLNLTASSNHQTCLLRDQSSDVWIGFKGQGGTVNAGLAMYDGSSWNLYSTTSTLALPSNNVTSLAEDASGNVWIGTDAGLVKYHGGNFTTYTTANGLPDNAIKSLGIDGSQLYIGTYHGLSRYDGSVFTNYTVGNGALQSDSVTAIKAESSGVIWLGGFTGFQRFIINNSYTLYSSVSFPLVYGAYKVNCIYVDPSGMKWIGTNESSSNPSFPFNYHASLLMFNGSSILKADSVYAIYGSSIPNSILDIQSGLNNGIVFKAACNDSVSLGSGYGSCLVEISPGGKIFQYFSPATSAPLGDFINKQGSTLYVSHDGQAAYNNTKKIMYYEFNLAGYQAFNRGSGITNDNFKLLDINQVSAGIANRGDMHWNIGGNGQAMYVVPKTIDNRKYGTSSNFASALWFSGYDGGGMLHTSSQTYRQGSSGFWPGPLDTTFVSSSQTAPYYDKVWKVSYQDINNFVNNHVATEDILTWPGNGTHGAHHQLAPYVDVNNNGIYDPLVGGDYPKIKGDETVYFIFNDKNTDLTFQNSRGCNAFGFEIHGMAYAYGCLNSLQGHPELNYTTFYNYRIINRSLNTYNNVQIGYWTDVDLGYYGDDYIGTNVGDNYTYAYNGDGYDDNTNGRGYASYPPAQGFAFMKTPLAPAGDGIDNNHDGTIDEPGEQVMLSHSTYFNNSFPGVLLQTVDPSSCMQYANYLNSMWRSGDPFTCGGNAYGGTTPTNFVYPGDPNGTTSTDPTNQCGNWTEATASNSPGDRRIIMGSGPYTFLPGEEKEIEYALVTSFDSTSANNPLGSVAKLKTDIQHLRAFYSQTNHPNCFQNAPMAVHEQSENDLFGIYPNPAHTSITIQVQASNSKANYEILDVLGHIIMQGSITALNGEAAIQLNEMPRGVYFIRLYIDNHSSIKKFVKD